MRPFGSSYEQSHLAVAWRLRRCVVSDEAVEIDSPASFSILQSAPNDNNGELNATEIWSKPVKRHVAEICFLATPWRENFVGSHRT